MPLMDGYEATQKIRHELNSPVPVVALTANFLLMEKTKCLQIGMNDYLPKPFTKEDILNKVDQWINSREEKLQENSRENLNGQVFSLDILEELSGGDKQFQEEMLTLFLHQSKTTFSELKRFSEIEDLNGIRSTAHKFKSSFGIIGANSDLLDELENVPDDEPDFSAINSKLMLLEEKLEKIFSFINDSINPPK